MSIVEKFLWEINPATRERENYDGEREREKMKLDDVVADGKSRIKASFSFSL